MKPDKLRKILKDERPDLVEVPVQPAAKDALPADVDERAGAESTWARKEPRAAAKRDLSKGLSSDEVRAAFTPRKLGRNLGGADAAARNAPDAQDEPGIVRAAKAKTHPAGAAAGDAAESSGPGVKDFIVDDKHGIIGSQG